MLERVELVEQVAAVALPLVGDALGDDALDGEPGLCRIAAGGERLVAAAQKARLGKPPLQLGQHDVGRNQSVVSGVVALEERDHRADARDRPCRSPGFRPVCTM